MIWQPDVRTVRTLCLLLSCVAAVLRPVAAATAQDDTQIALDAAFLLKSRCYGCHGRSFNGSAQLNVMDRAGLLEHGYILPGKANESPILQRVVEGEMPPEDSGVAPLNAEEKELLRSWIDQGAPTVKRESRAFKPMAAVLGDIYRDLTAADPADRPYLRYFTLTHLSNNPAVSEFDLRLFRAALSKAINSLSREPEILVPIAIDPEQSILRLDLRRVGWTPKQWRWLLAQYPYGVHFENDEDERLASLDEQMDALSASDLCWIRGDWFANHATRPPIYDRFLDLPPTVQQLENSLNVDFPFNFNNNRLQRAAFASSGVSQGNRLVERHPASFGYYWKSYDFKDKGAAGNLFQLPLGPLFAENPFAEQAFVHDGGEMIFSLPNGLQGYMLADGAGNKIDRGPIEVVRDSKETAGTPEIVNGLSCIHCHRHGMISFEDTLRDGLGVFGEPRRKVRSLHVERPVMNRVVAADRARFLTALEQAIGPFLQKGDDADKAIDQFAEPVGAIARLYQRDLGPEQAAFELGIDKPAQLRELVLANSELQKLGLGPLARGESIKRAEWESTAAFVSPFQEASRILGLATPLNVSSSGFGK